MKTVAHVSPWSGKCCTVRQWQQERRRWMKKKKEKKSQTIWMSSRWQLDGFSPLWVFDGCDWCEAAWLHPSVADAFESFLCQPTDSLVTWVSRHWLIGRLIAWLQPRGTASQPIKYLHSAGRDHPLLLFAASGVWSPVLSVGRRAFMRCCRMKAEYCSYTH